MVGPDVVEVRERGAGETVCLIHAGVFSSWFSAVFDEPALDDYRVVMPVRPGYGRSPVPVERAELAAHSRAVTRLLRDLDAQPAHLVGHSSSCCISLQVALDAPDCVASLTLFEPAKPSGAIREAESGTYVGPAMQAAARGDLGLAFDLFMRGVAGDDYLLSLERRLGAAGVSAAEQESAYFFADEMPALAAWSFGASEGAKILVPALLLVASESKPRFHENAAILGSMLPDHRVRTLAGADHAAPLTHPSAFAGAVADFVREHSVATTRR
jgi:pimeloyl-ACP methyl ester carboxylesterase